MMGRGCDSVSVTCSRVWARSKERGGIETRPRVTLGGRTRESAAGRPLSLFKVVLVAAWQNLFDPVSCFNCFSVNAAERPEGVLCFSSSLSFVSPRHPCLFRCGFRCVLLSFTSFGFARLLIDVVLRRPCSKSARWQLIDRL